MCLSSHQFDRRRRILVAMQLAGGTFIFAGFVVSTEVFGARVRLGPIVMRREEEAPAT